MSGHSLGRAYMMPSFSRFMDTNTPRPVFIASSSVCGVRCVRRLSVRWREPRQLTAAGQSLTLTPEGQPQTRLAPDSRTATATRLHNLNIDLKRNALKVPMFIVLTTMVQGDIFLRAFSRTANQGCIRGGPDGVRPFPP